MRKPSRRLILAAGLAVSIGATACASTTVVIPADTEAQARFAALKSGSAKPQASNFGNWGANRANARALLDAAKWRELADLVQRTAPDRDVAWYYLGRAAAGLGYPDAGQIYFQRSIEAANSSVPGRQCGAVLDLCDGFSFPTDAQKALSELKSPAPVSVGGTTTTTEPLPRPAPQPTTTPLADATPIAPATSLKRMFAAPAKLCNALASMGLGTAVKGGWKADRSGAGGWVCSSNYLDVGPPAEGTALPSNISFYVSGTSQARATKISFILNINDPNTQARTLSKLKAAITKLFGAFGGSAPNELIRAIGMGSAYTAGGGAKPTIRFERNTYRIVEFKLSLIDN